jgi:SAM-dependent methyltransferase
MNSQMLDILVCPQCHGGLSGQQGGLFCQACKLTFTVNRYGYYDLVLDRTLAEEETTSDEFAQVQKEFGLRRFRQFLKPYLDLEPTQRVLDVGSGLGGELAEMKRTGYDVHGVDLPCLAPFWAQNGNDPEIFCCAQATRLPFRDDSFDLVYSLGVIEHVSAEVGGKYDYWGPRQEYANELVRVTRPGGRILVSCPNKRFPIDLQHEPGAAKRVRQAIWRWTGLNFHATWGENDLLSYAETRRLFRRAGASSFRAPSLRHFFSFASCGEGWLRLLRPAAEIYINSLPAFLRQTGLNPYLLLEVRK